MRSFLQHLPKRSTIIVLFCSILVLTNIFLILTIWKNQLDKQHNVEAAKAQTQTETNEVVSRKKITPTVTAIPTPTPTTIVKTLSVVSDKKLLIGIGPEADQATGTRIAKEGRISMLTSWYNGPNDLSWMTGWKHKLVPDAYAKGHTLHLITFTDHPEGHLETKYGSACGREYPVSGRFLDDMRQLAETYKGTGKLYVSLLTEFQTYPCEDNVWSGNENYYNALKDNYRAAVDIFHTHAPNSKVAFVWGGWQARWDDPGRGGGRSLIPHFADVMSVSDFTAFQAMQGDTNLNDIRIMTETLAAYKKPVMLAHYKPDNGSQGTFDTDMRGFFTDEYINEITSKGLFALSFMDSNNLNNSEDTYQFIKNATVKYGK